MSALAIRRTLTRSAISDAKALQRSGFTLSEIASRLGVDRTLIVNALYWEAMPQFVAVDIAHSRIPFAGKDSA